MPPEKRKVHSLGGRPPLPPEIRRIRKKRCIGIVEQPDWDRWRMAAMASNEKDLSKFITLQVNRAADELLKQLSPQKLTALKEKVAKAK